MASVGVSTLRLRLLTLRAPLWHSQQTSARNQAWPYAGTGTGLPDVTTQLVAVVMSDVGSVTVVTRR